MGKFKIISENKRVVFGLIAVALVMAVTVGMSVYTFTASLKKKSQSEAPSSVVSSSIQLTPNADLSVDNGETESASTGDSDNTENDASFSYDDMSNLAELGVDLSTVENPMDLLDDEAFIKYLKDRGMTDEDISTGIKSIQRYLDNATNTRLMVSIGFTVTAVLFTCLSVGSDYVDANDAMYERMQHEKEPSNEESN